MGIKVTLICLCSDGGGGTLDCLLSKGIFVSLDHNFSLHYNFLTVNVLKYYLRIEKLKVNSISILHFSFVMYQVQFTADDQYTLFFLLFKQQPVSLKTLYSGNLFEI